MDNAVYVRNLEAIGKSDVQNPGLLYFGNEFCEKLIPDGDALSRALSYAKENGLIFVFVTPYCTDSGIEKLKGLLPLLPDGTEVVFNDWGILGHIRERGLVPVLGRLLVSIKRDVRIDPSDGKNLEYFRTCNLESLAFQDFLIENGISRVELDNVTQGYRFRPPKGIRISLHYPFVYVTTSRKCVSARCAKVSSPNLASYSECDFECTKYGFGAELKTGRRPLILKGNSIFYENDDVGKNVGQTGADRLIHSPELPFSIEEDRLWDNYYAHHESDAAWGVSNADAHIVDFMRYHGFFRKGAKILDAGCGQGKNAEYFLANGLKTYGFDISSRAIDYCRKRNPGGSFSVHDASIPFRENFFDIICDGGCLHSSHPGKHSAIVEAHYKSLKKGGHMFIRIFNDDRKGREGERKENLFYVDTLPVYGYSKKQILGLLGEDRFVVEKMIFSADQGTEGIYYIYLRKR